LCAGPGQAQTLVRVVAAWEHHVLYSNMYISLLPNTHFFFSVFTFFHLIIFAHMSDLDDYDGDCDQVSHIPPRPPSVSSFGSDDVVRSQRMLRPPLRSRPNIDFPHHFAAETGHGFSVPSASRHPPFHSHMSSSTLRSSLNPPAPTFPQKPQSFYDTLLAPDLPPEVLAALSDTQLYHNPTYRQLQQNYQWMCEILTAYMGRNLMEFESRARRSDTPDIHQGALFFLFQLQASANQSYP
jgi:hypothetical protein